MKHREVASRAKHTVCCVEVRAQQARAMLFRTTTDVHLQRTRRSTPLRGLLASTGRCAKGSIHGSKRWPTLVSLCPKRD